MPSPHVHIIGDSITVQSAPLYVAQYHPSADIDAANGRTVSALASCIQARLDAGPSPNLWILALGTNEGPSPMTYTRTQFVAAYDLIPQTSRVILVTPWRNPALFGERRHANMWTIVNWMRDLDAYRPNSSIAPWAWTNELDPSAGYIGPDGVHPTPAGAQKWADLVFAAEN